MKFEAVTIKDIAKELGLSTSTVSRALRDSYEISAETKRRVVACAKRLDYRPNPIALSLKERSSKSIGVIVSEIANSFFSQAINGIESIAYKKGYNVIIAQSQETVEREVSQANFLSSRSIDGLIISLSSETAGIEHINSLHNRGLPLVFFDRITDEVDTNKVIIDNFDAAYKATAHLIDQGHKRIACLLSAGKLSITRERIAGYEKALTNHNLSIDSNLIQTCEHSGLHSSEVHEAVNHLLDLNPRPDAILGLSDKLTVGCLRILQSRNIKIPDEIALVGFSNSDLSELLYPSLTVIKQPAFEMGEIAISLLLKEIESKRPTRDYETKILKAELVVRNSSRKLTGS